MNESGTESHGSHDRLKHAAEAGVVVAAVGALSASGWQLWQRQRREAQTIREVRNSGEIVFDNEKLELEKRELLARIAVRVRIATMGTGNQVIGLKALAENLDMSERKTEAMLKLLLPENVTEEAQNDAYVGVRKGGLDGQEGYFSKERLNELMETGHSEMLNQAEFELTNGIDY